MNKEQRKYLSDRVESTYKRQLDELKHTEPKRPSLNNYLVAACLDGSIQLQSVEVIKAKVKDMVLRFGSHDTLIYSDNDRRYHTYRDDDDEDEAAETVKLAATDVFIFPTAYQVALDRYNEEWKVWKALMDDLRAQHDTVMIKVNVGSDEVLSRLISEVDNMADIKLINTSLTLVPKQLKEKNL